MMENELKPCPFCGAPAEIRVYLASNGKKSYTVRCKNMCAVTCGHVKNGRWRATLKREAIETWNRRTNENEDNNNND